MSIADPSRILFILTLALGAGCSPHATRDSDLPATEIPASFDAPAGPTVEAPGRLVEQFRRTRDWTERCNGPSMRTSDFARPGQDSTRPTPRRRSPARFSIPTSISTRAPAGPRVDPADRPANSTDRFAIGLGLSWELDLWKKIANRADSAALVARASRADAEQTALLLSGSVVDLWFTIQEKQQLLALITEQIDLSRTLLELTELRYGQGVGDALQVLQQRLQLESVTSALPEIRSTLETSRNQLSVLLARAPESIDTEFSVAVEPTLPELPPFPTLPTPKDLLDRRPDLRAAYDRVAAADLEVAVAIADMLPAIRLSLAGSFSSDQFSSLFDSTVASITGSLLQPVFDGDRREAEADRRRAILNERLDAFTERFLVALREVEDAIDRERNLVDLLRQIRNQVELANRTLSESRLRFANGQIEYLDVITAIRSLQELQRRDVTVQRSVLANRASLLLALGGDWTRSLTPPEGEDSDQKTDAESQTAPSDESDAVATESRSLRNSDA